jgi:hypothetical protein
MIRRRGAIAKAGLRPARMYIVRPFFGNEGALEGLNEAPRLEGCVFVS